MKSSENLTDYYYNLQARAMTLRNYVECLTFNQNLHLSSGVNLFSLEARSAEDHFYFEFSDGILVKLDVPRTKELREGLIHILDEPDIGLEVDESVKAAIRILRAK